jgi:hypothetical protein
VTHFRDYNNDGIAMYSPINPFLLEALLSGFSFKYKLSETPEMYGSIDDGLDTQAPHSLKDWEPQLLVVGACIQLLLHGSRIREGYYQWQREYVVRKLKVHKMAETVKDPLAVRVLEVSSALASSRLSAFLPCELLSYDLQMR